MPHLKFLMPSASPAGCYQQGQVAEVEAEAARALVESGVAVRVPSPPVVETAALEPGERAVRAPGRPRRR